MKVDQVGLYYVANIKWGKNAMANIMIKACQKAGFTNNVTAIDLTASVGGMTLGLAKTDVFDIQSLPSRSIRNVPNYVEKI